MSQTKKIVHFTSSISKSSGVMSVIMNYYRYLDKRKFQFDFICFKKVEEDYSREIEELGGKVHYVSSPNKILRLKKEMNEIFKYNEYTIIHNHEVYLSKIFKIFILEQDIKLVTHSHNTQLSDKLLSRMRNTVLCNKIEKYSDYNIACSKLAGQVLFKKAEFEVVYNSVNPEKFKFNREKRELIREELSISEESLIGNIGRYTNQKNQLFLIEVFSELVKLNDSVKLILIGEGPLEQELKSLVLKKNLNEKIIILPFKSNISDYFQAFDLFVLPSLFEGLPVVGVEAQYSGLKCIFSDTITKEIGTNSSEFLSLKDSAANWAIQINESLNDFNERSRVDVIDEMNKKGFNILAATKKLERIYFEL